MRLAKFFVVFALVHQFFPLANLQGESMVLPPPPYGIDTRPAATAYLGAFPATVPANSGSWPGSVPTTLSATGAFVNPAAATLVPSTGLVPFDLNSELWVDGAKKTRWISVPYDGTGIPTAGEVITWSENDPWVFPLGTVIVKHFELYQNENDLTDLKRLETRFLVNGSSGWYGLTYKWNSGGTAADLQDNYMVNNPEEFLDVTQSPSGTFKQKYTYPVNACMTCHNANSGHILGVINSQLNRDFTYPSSTVTDNQIRTLNHIEFFDVTLDENAISGYDALNAVDDISFSLDNRVRSFLHSNCSLCHRPGGGTTSSMDLRAHVFDSSQVSGLSVTTSLGIEGAQEVNNHDTGRSILFQRVVRTPGQGNQMPLLGRNYEYPAAINALQEWIDGLSGDAGLVAPVFSPDPGYDISSNPVALFRDAAVEITISHPESGESLLSQPPIWVETRTPIKSHVRAMRMKEPRLEEMLEFRPDRFAFMMPPNWM